jgi:hypothetical protein
MLTELHQAQVAQVV